MATVEVTQAFDKDCHILDELGFQVGAVAKVIGHYASEWPEPVRILGIQKIGGKLNFTIGTLDGEEPTDGFRIDELLPEPRRLTAEQANAAEIERLQTRVAELTEGLREIEAGSYTAEGAAYRKVCIARRLLLNNREGDNATG